MDWDALARAAVARRVELGYQTRNAFIEASGIGARTVGDIETARRTSYARQTLVRLERALRWATGSVQSVLDGGEPKPVVEQQAEGAALDPRSLERYGDDLELLQVVADAGLSHADEFRVMLRLRKRRAELHQQLLEELGRIIAEVSGGSEKGRAG